MAIHYLFSHIYSLNTNTNTHIINYKEDNLHQTIALNYEYSRTHALPKTGVTTLIKR
jgi:hypothetical protein